MAEELNVEQEEKKEQKVGFFKRLVSGLAKTRDNIVSGIDSIFSGFSSMDSMDRLGTAGLHRR